MLITNHDGELIRLNRIEGQIRGIKTMIKQRRYCIDVLTQISSVIGAIKSVEENILGLHLEGCVRESFVTGDQREKEMKIREVIHVLKKFRKN